MLQRLWLWSPSLQIFMVFIVAASPTWRSTLLTIHRFCVSPHLATDRKAHPSSCAPLKTVSSQHWQRISVLNFVWLDIKARIFKSGCLKFDHRFTISLQSLVKLLCIRWWPQPVVYMCSFSLWQMNDIWYFFHYELNLDEFFYFGQKLRAS